jgi:large subunit ribosomal protein L32e
MDKSLLELRNKMKKKKPTFIRQDAYKRKRLPDNWRSPRGLHSKFRYNKKGNAKKVSPGFKSPAVVRGLSRDGYFMHVIATTAALKNLDKNKDAVIIASTVGNKKRIMILEEAIKKGMHIMFIKDAEAQKGKLQQEFTARLEKKKSKLQQKEEKKKEAEKKAEKKGIEKRLTDEKLTEKSGEKAKESGEKTQEMSTEEKKESENKENEKLLTKPQ